MLAFTLLVGIFDRRHKPSAHMVASQAAEESVKVTAFEACRRTLPALELKPQENVFRAPGRYQVIRRRQHDQITCLTWQGKVQYVDTALIQPGNGDITR